MSAIGASCFMREKMERWLVQRESYRRESFYEAMRERGAYWLKVREAKEGDGVVSDGGEAKTDHFGSKNHGQERLDLRSFNVDGKQGIVECLVGKFFDFYSYKSLDFKLRKQSLTHGKERTKEG
ncbi:unnamed protein product, partial [Dovyalis caffra]